MIQKPTGIDEVRAAINRLPHEKGCISEIVAGRCECAKAAARAWMAALERNIFTVIETEKKLLEARKSNRFLRRQLKKEEI